MNLDKILVEVGQFGRYQKGITVFIGLIIIFYVFASNEYEFTAAKVPHRCRIPACDGLSSDIPHPEFRPDWLLNAINGESLNTFESCTRFPDNTSKPLSNNTCPAEWFDKTRDVDCNEYIYEYTNTAFYDFNLACNEKKRTALDSFTFLLTIKMLITVGDLADKKGRRPLLVITVFLAACLGFARSFITSYWWFMIMRLLQMGFGSTAFVLCYIIGIEMTGPNYRVVVGAILSTMIPLGQIILNSMVWAGTSWRALLLIIFTPQLLVVSYFWIIPESVRWLLCKKDYVQTEIILRKIAKINGKEFLDKFMYDLPEAPGSATKDEEKKKCFAVVRLILKTPGMVPRIFMNLLWFTTYSLLQYSIDKRTLNLSDQSHLNHIYVAVFAILGIWTAAYFLDRIGRKRVLIGGYLLCASCQFVFVFVPEGSSTLVTIVSLLSKYFLAVVSSSMNLYSLELFPTEQRGFLFAYFFMHTKLGEKLGATIASLGPISWMGLPSLLFTCLAIISAYLYVRTPETRGTKLPDTMAEASQIGKKENTDVIQQSA